MKTLKLVAWFSFAIGLAIPIRVIFFDHVPTPSQWWATAVFLGSASVMGMVLDFERSKKKDVDDDR